MCVARGVCRDHAPPPPIHPGQKQGSWHNYDKHLPLRDCFLAGLFISGLTKEKYNTTLRFCVCQSCDGAVAMASERSGVTSIVQNESLLAYYFHGVMHCLNLNASAAVKVSAKQNAKNVARKVNKMFKTSAKKTALLKSCIKEDVSSQEETKRYLCSRFM